MRYLRKYNESKEDVYALEDIEGYKSNYISNVKFHTTTQEADGHEIFEYVVTDVEGKENILLIDTSYKKSPAVRKVRVYYPSRTAYFIDINNLRDWKQIFEKIELQNNNRTEHMKRMDSVSKMFDSVTKEIITEHFSDLIDISVTHQISTAEEFNKPLYWEIYLEMKYNLSDGGNMLLDDKSREILDMIIVDTKRIESDFNVRTSVRISNIATIKNPVIKICVFAKDSNGDAIGYKIS